jgi:hypothetical protein
MKKVDAELLEDIRRLNVVLHEDNETITAVAPCPTYIHHSEMVAPTYVVVFKCPHGEGRNAFCTPCTADRREGVFACMGWSKPGANPHPDCPGSRAVAVRTLVPTTREKA